MLEKKASFDHPYPATKVMFLPDMQTTRPDMVATTGDYLRLWNIKYAWVLLGASLIATTRIEHAHHLLHRDGGWWRCRWGMTSTGYTHIIFKTNMHAHSTTPN